MDAAFAAIATGLSAVIQFFIVFCVARGIMKSVKRKPHSLSDSGHSPHASRDDPCSDLISRTEVRAHSKLYGDPWDCPSKYPEDN